VGICHPRTLPSMSAMGHTLPFVRTTTQISRWVFATMLFVPSAPCAPHVHVQLKDEALRPPAMETTSLGVGRQRSRRVGFKFMKWTTENSRGTTALDAGVDRKRERDSVVLCDLKLHPPLLQRSVEVEIRQQPQPGVIRARVWQQQHPGIVVSIPGSPVQPKKRDRKQ
jgi:hypothetical protein